MKCLLRFILALAAPLHAAERPNVVFILADDLGYGDFSCYGATHFETPAADRLAREGMRFTDAHSPSAVCTPSRYSVLTGRYAWRTWLKDRLTETPLQPIPHPCSAFSSRRSSPSLRSRPRRRTNPTSSSLSATIRAGPTTASWGIR